MKILIILSFLALRAYCPEQRCLYIEKVSQIKPYEAIWAAICTHESGNNRYAYHMEKDGWPAVGIAQIRWDRLKDYNQNTGHHYQMKDMYDPGISKKIFTFYAHQIGPYRPEKIIRCWNGGPNGMKIKQTYKYYLNVKKLL